MKTLLLIRHAKSSWDNAILHDRDRPLNERGRRDAPEMAARLVRNGIPIDRFVSSPAKRARKTAELFIREYGRKEEEILFIPELYNAELQTFYKVIAALDDKDDHVAIFSHNPGITAFVNSLAVAQLDNMPTCGVFAVKSEASSWAGFSSSERKFLFFDTPKSLND
jgi:phosphohistidine phosphatase